MDNQKDQSGTTPDQPNAGRNTNLSAAASRKPAATPPTSDSAANPSAQSPSTANAGTSRLSGGQPTNAQKDTLLDTALSSGKKWIEGSGVLDSVNQLPQSIKDLGNRAVARVGGLSTTQKVVGGAILAAGLGWLATRKGKSGGSSDSSSYNYGRQRVAGSYGRKSYGYQAPDAGPSSRTDSGSPYGNSNSRFGNSGSYSTEASAAGNAGIKSGSGRDDSGTSYGHASARTDHGPQSSGTTSDYTSKSTDYRSIE